MQKAVEKNSITIFVNNLIERQANHHFLLNIATETHEKNNVQNEKNNNNVDGDNDDYENTQRSNNVNLRSTVCMLSRSVCMELMQNETIKCHKTVQTKDSECMKAGSNGNGNGNNSRTKIQPSHENSAKENQRNLTLTYINL